MKVIGITGGIGSGKSLVSDIMRDTFHAYLINTDQIAHKFMEKGEVSYRLIVEYFGEEILSPSGEIDRGVLGKIVYKDEDKLLKLNSFSHPYVMEYVRNLITEKKKEKIELICVETALPIQAGLKDFCDAIWYVYAPEGVRRERLKQSRNYDEQKMNEIFKNQISDFEYRNASTHVIINDYPIEKIKEQIQILLENYEKL
ncbi:dephospho-CoA kinase [Anaerocolumna sp. AGMB13025]|uniref:dephospho-CoA kinase n=1 Tax=Anaerocolumna sp. AGMB13025 TaxID=3039116 RepID=UPI00241D9EB4|nr:dephospho-CoA kinase [Anaerocolumna sp. AGMB13025]WFR54941.1 dephospho-CoA kinase [Anaerocolumna sp. AGMB13025]